MLSHSAKKNRLKPKSLDGLEIRSPDSINTSNPTSLNHHNHTDVNINMKQRNHKTRFESVPKSKLRYVPAITVHVLVFKHFVLFCCGFVVSFGVLCWCCVSARFISKSDTRPPLTKVGTHMRKTTLAAQLNFSIETNVIELFDGASSR